MDIPEEPMDKWLGEWTTNQAFLDEETILKLLEARIHQLLTAQPDLLWSFLYRLDVEETKIQHVLVTSGEVALDLARLILQRQQSRLETKKKYRSKSSENPYDWEDLE